MRLSTSTCIHERVLWGKNLFYTCKDSIEACVGAGYKVLDMNFASYSRGTLPMTQPDWEYWVKEQKEFADSLGVEWNQGHAHFYNMETASPKEREWHEELIRRSIVGAGIMGVKWLVIHPINAKDGGWYSREKSLEANLEMYTRHVELAKKHNVGICTENIFEGQKSRRFGAAPEEIVELYDAVGEPESFGICWDTGHGHMTDVDQPAALRLIGKRLKALHVADNFGQKDDHLAPYFGTIEWEPIMKALKDIEYAGDFTFEIHNFTNGLPHGLHEQVLRLTYELGQFMLELAK